MIGSLLARGMLAGMVAGLLAFAVAYVLGEPQISRAIQLEEQAAHARVHTAGDAHGAAAAPAAEPVSRGVQSTAGLAAGMIAMSVALGGLLALAFAWAHGRAGALGARSTAALLAVGAYLAITVVPFTKYPANPPAVGHADTIGRRTVLYLAMILVSVLSVVSAARIRRALLGRLGRWNAAIAAVAALLVLIAIAQLMLPAVDEVPAGFDATLLWRFRLASLIVNATIWIALGLGFGLLAQRRLGAGDGRRPVATHASAPASGGVAAP